MRLAIFVFSLIAFASFAQAKTPEVNLDAHRILTCPADDIYCKSLTVPPVEENVWEKLDFERAVDGDTFVASGRRIRVWGINAPERNAPAYLAAKMLLEALVKDGHLTCKLVDIDRYQRSVMHCLVDGRDIGSMIVQMGMATDYRRYSGGYYQIEEEAAKAQLRGIWKDFPTEDGPNNP